MLEIQQTRFFMKKYLEKVKHVPLFNGLSDEEICLILNCINASITEYEKDCMIFREDDKAEKIGIVLSGSVQIERYDIDGTRDIIAVINTPNLFGEVYAFADIDCLPVNVIAAEKSSVMLIDGKCIKSPCSKLCDSHYTLIKNLLRIVTQKNLILNQKISLLSKRTTRQKLISYLMSEAKRQKKYEFDIQYSRQELADYLCVERSAMAAELSKLCKDGIIETKRCHFKLLNYHY